MNPRKETFIEQKLLERGFPLGKKWTWTVDRKRGLIQLVRRYPRMQKDILTFFIPPIGEEEFKKWEEE